MDIMAVLFPERQLIFVPIGRNKTDAVYLLASPSRDRLISEDM